VAGTELHASLLLAELGGRETAASFLHSSALQPGGTSADSVIYLENCFTKVVIVTKRLMMLLFGS